MNTATPMRTVAIHAFASLALVLCASAQAQVQAQAQAARKCRIDGRVVFQATPCPAEALVGSAAPQATPVDTPAAPKKKAHADMPRERDGADSGRQQARDAQGDGANVLRSRMGAV